MPEETDLETKAPASVRTETGANGGKSVDYEAKYRGLSKKNTKLEEENESLRNKYADALEAQGEAEAKARNSGKDLQKQLTEAQSALTTAQSDAQKWEKQFKGIEARNNERKAINEKFPALTDLFDAGDLKSLEEFEKPEDYTAYLNRLAAKIVPQAQQPTQEQSEQVDVEQPVNPLVPGLSRRDFLAGATPSVNLGSRDGAKVRTMSEIQDAMELLDPRDKDYSKKYLPLEAEMNASMASSRTRISI